MATPCESDSGSQSDFTAVDSYVVIPPAGPGAFNSTQATPIGATTVLIQTFVSPGGGKPTAVFVFDFIFFGPLGQAGGSITGSTGWNLGPGESRWDILSVDPTALTWQVIVQGGVNGDFTNTSNTATVLADFFCGGATPTFQSPGAYISGAFSAIAVGGSAAVLSVGRSYATIIGA